jgi:hypothetical protein
VLWLDARQITGLVDGVPVASWSDASPALRTATQSTPSSRPIYRTNAINGRPALRFDGIDDYLTVAATLVPGSQNRTLLVVARPDVIGNDSIIDLGNGSVANAAFMITPEHATRINGGNRIWVQSAQTSTATIAAFALTGTTTANLLAWVNGVASPRQHRGRPDQHQRQYHGGWLYGGAGGLQLRRRYRRAHRVQPRPERRTERQTVESTCD